MVVSGARGARSGPMGLEEAGDLCRMILLNAPLEDHAGQRYDAHRPFRYGSREVVRRLIQLSSAKMLVLDAAYADENDEYSDVRCLETILETEAAAR